MIIILLAAAVLALQISIESDLADYLKRFLYLHFLQESKLKALSNPNFWHTLWGVKWMFIMFPITYTLSIIIFIWYWLNKMVNCAYCLGYHISWLLMYYLDYDLELALIYGLLTIPAIKLIEKLNESKN